MQHQLEVLQAFQAELEHYDSEIDACMREIQAEQAGLHTDRQTIDGFSHELDCLFGKLASRESELDFADSPALAPAKAPTHPSPLTNVSPQCPTLDRLTDMAISGQLASVLTRASSESNQAHASKLSALTSRLEAIDKSCAQLGAEAMVVDADISTMTRTLRTEEARVAASAAHRLELEIELAAAQATSADLASQISMQKIRRAELGKLQAALQEIKADNDEIDAYRTNLRSSLQKVPDARGSLGALPTGGLDDDDHDAFSLRAASAGTSNAAKKPRSVRFSSPTRDQANLQSAAASSSNTGAGASSSTGSSTNTYKNIFLRKYFQPPS